MPEILKNIKAEDRLKKIRIVSENDDVMGGQPEADGMKENDNNAIFDLACSVMHALAEVAKVDQKAIPQILDALGDSRTAGASQRIVNEVNKLAKAAQTAANQANDKANQAKQDAYNAEQKAGAAQKTSNEAIQQASKKRDQSDFIFLRNDSFYMTHESKGEFCGASYSTDSSENRIRILINGDKTQIIAGTNGVHELSKRRIGIISTDPNVVVISSNTGYEKHPDGRCIAWGEGANEITLPIYFKKIYTAMATPSQSLGNIRVVINSGSSISILSSGSGTTTSRYLVIGEV